LPTEYFHVIFTIPEEMARIAFYNKEVVYNILFKAASQTLLTIARDPKHLGAEIGFFAILHTWGQNLLHHPHVHCVVPGGGLSPDYDRWIGCKPGFFLPVRVLSRLFRRLFLEAIQRAFENGKLSFFANPNHPETRRHSPNILLRSENANGWSMPNRPSEVHARCSITWGVTPIGLRFPTNAFSA
jgi:hypothetical protein